MESTKIQTFNSGTLEIWEEGGSAPLYGRIPFETRTVGSRRAYDAQQAGHQISKMVRIPVVPGDWNDRYVWILDGSGHRFRYSVGLCQEIMDTAPRCLQLTLELPNIGWAQNLGV